MAAGPVRIAAVGTNFFRHNGEYSSFQNNPDYAVRIFHEREIPRLSEQLDQFDIVINQTLSCYQQPDYWKGETGKFKKFVENGGIMILLDSNYDFALEKVIYPWGENFKLQRSLCKVAAKSKFWDISEKFNRFPHDLAGAFAPNHQNWQHLFLPEGWNGMCRCEDGHYYAVYKRAGKGILVVTTFAALQKTPDRVQAFREFVENILAGNALEQMGLEVVRYSKINLFGENTFEFALRNIRRKDNVLCGHLQILFEKQILADRNFNTVLKPGQLFEIESPCTIERSGKIEIKITINDRTFRKDADIELLPLTAYPLRTKFHPANASCAGFRVILAEEYSAPEYNTVFTLNGKEFSLKRLNKTLYTTDLSVFPPGKYEFQGKLLNKKTGKKIFATKGTAIEISGKNPAICIDSQGNIQKNGQGVFLFGMYHVSWKLPPENRMEALRFLIDSGYNCLHASMIDAPGANDAMAALAEEKNMMLLLEGASVRKDKKYTSVLAWNIGDEPELYGIPPEELEKTAAKIKAEDPDRPVYTVFMNTESFNDAYLCIADIIAHDCYPIPTMKIGVIYHNMRLLVERVEGMSRTPIAVLQSFYHKNAPLGGMFSRKPTAGEIRNMMYQAICAGVKGILFYAYQDNGFNLSDHPGLKDTMRSFPQEIAGIQKYLLHGTRTYLATGNPNVYATEWRLKHGSALVIIVNVSSEEENAVIGGQKVTLSPLECRTLQ